MQVSSVSDFEHFAQKFREHIAYKIKSLEDETSAYVLKKENETTQTQERWLEDARYQWDKEYHDLERQHQNTIEEEMNKEWSKYIKEYETALRSLLQKELKEAFPKLAECFLSKISKLYETGVFTMPEAYMPLVKKEGLSLQKSAEEKVIFTSGNLYIEYSLERIMEELDEEIILMLTKMNEKAG